MGLFGKKKKEEPCCCGVSDLKEQTAQRDSGADGVKVLGSGCAKCSALEKRYRKRWQSWEWMRTLIM